jgi:hypothetical protein
MHLLTLRSPPPIKGIIVQSLQNKRLSANKLLKEASEDAESVPGLEIISDFIQRIRLTFDDTYHIMDYTLETNQEKSPLAIISRLID